MPLGTLLAKLYHFLLICAIKLETLPHMCFTNKSDITVHNTDANLCGSNISLKNFSHAFLQCPLPPVKRKVYIKDYTSENGEVTCRHYDKIHFYPLSSFVCMF